jgi:hypothetical protein
MKLEKYQTNRLNKFLVKSLNWFLGFGPQALGFT